MNRSEMNEHMIHIFGKPDINVKNDYMWHFGYFDFRVMDGKDVYISDRRTGSVEVIEGMLPEHILSKAYDTSLYGEGLAC